MKIYEICDRCGTVHAVAEMDGPTHVIDEWLSRTGSDLGLCPKWCGGKVRRVKESDLTRGSQSPQQVYVILGYAIFIAISGAIGGTWVVNLLANNFNWWLVGLFAITIIYALRYARYIFVLPSPEKPLEESIFVTRRMAYFLTFPSLTYVIVITLWSLLHSWDTAVIVALLGGWFISKSLQKSILAQEDR